MFSACDGGPPWAGTPSGGSLRPPVSGGADIWGHGRVRTSSGALASGSRRACWEEAPEDPTEETPPRVEGPVGGGRQLQACTCSSCRRSRRGRSFWEAESPWPAWAGRPCPGPGAAARYGRLRVWCFWDPWPRGGEQMTGTCVLVVSIYAFSLKRSPDSCCGCTSRGVMGGNSLTWELGQDRKAA